MYQLSGTNQAIKVGLHQISELYRNSVIDTGHKYR